MRDVRVADRLSAVKVQAYVSLFPEPSLSVPHALRVACRAERDCRECPLREPCTVRVSVSHNTDEWMRWVSLTPGQLLGCLRAHLRLPPRCPLSFSILETRELAPVCLSGRNGDRLFAWTLVHGFAENQLYELEIVKLHSWKGELAPIIVGARRVRPRFEGFTLSLAESARAARRLSGPPLAVLDERTRTLEAATGIAGRPALLRLMLLVLHSRLRIEWRGHPLGRAPLDVIVIGDRGVGKSESAARVLRYFDLDPPLSGEIVSRAGLLAGAIRRPGGSFAPTPGRFPLLNRRAAIVDEAHPFLTSPGFEQTSQWRSSGVVSMDMAGCNRSYDALVRVVWLANPIAPAPNLRTALEALVRRPEDRRRFDLGLFIPKGETPVIPRRCHAPDQTADRRLLLASWAKTDPLEFSDSFVPVVERAATRLRRSVCPRLPDLADPDAIEETLVRVAAAVAEATFRELDDDCIDAAAQIIEEQ